MSKDSSSDRSSPDVAALSDERQHARVYLTSLLRAACLVAPLALAACTTPVRVVETTDEALWEMGVKPVPHTRGEPHRLDVNAPDQGLYFQIKITVADREHTTFYRLLSQCMDAEQVQLPRGMYRGHLAEFIALRFAETYDLTRKLDRQENETVAFTLFPSDDARQIYRPAMVFGGLAVTFLPGSVAKTVVSAGSVVLRVGTAVAAEEHSQSNADHLRLNPAREPGEVLLGNLKRQTFDIPWSTVTNPVDRGLVSTERAVRLPEGACVIPIAQLSVQERALREAQVLGRQVRETVNKISQQVAVQRDAEQKQLTQSALEQPSSRPQKNNEHTPLTSKPVEKPVAPQPSVQLGAFRSESDARRSAQLFTQRYPEYIGRVRVIPGDDGLIRVRISSAKPADLCRTLKSTGWRECVVVK